MPTDISARDESVIESERSSARNQMVERQIARRGVSDPRVLAAMRRVPRELFVPEGLDEFAYDDTPLPIGEGQTISQPFIVALMAEAAEIGPADRVLEIGTGLGYAAAVLGAMAREVHTVERHPVLCEGAVDRLAALGADNVFVHCADGTKGWAAAAPYEAILVAAGGPGVPETLRRQLAIGGRLVIPVGDEGRHQRLVKLRRIGEDAFEEEDLGAVAFVPLIGAEGWPEPAPPTPRPETWRVAPAHRPPSAAERLRGAALPLPAIADPSFAARFDAYTEAARVVLLGEATHGTSEFYRARAAITRRLVEAHGFTIVAVEADWPDAAAIDRHIRNRPAGKPTERAFQRFPTWMWRNEEMAELVEWLRRWNGRASEKVAFYGLDLYSLNASVGAVLDYLERVDPATARIARERYGCLTPWQKDPAEYGLVALREGHARCEGAVLDVLDRLLRKRLDYVGADGESFLDAAQNARLVTAAERYYRAMYYGGGDSWNLRDSHMAETLGNLLAARGRDARAIVWAHNSHIGDARATEMGMTREEHNIGQLCRERFGAAARLIGFGTDRGTVAAASDWGGEMQVMPVRPSMEGSWERLARDSAVPRFLVDLREGPADATRAALDDMLLERAIGVVYRPETERFSHYFEAVLPRQFDAWAWFEETRAVTPLAGPPPHGAADTWPFGI